MENRGKVMPSQKMNSTVDTLSRNFRFLFWKLNRWTCNSIVAFATNWAPVATASSTCSWSCTFLDGIGTNPIMQAGIATQTHLQYISLRCPSWCWQNPKSWPRHFPHSHLNRNPYPHLELQLHFHFQFVYLEFLAEILNCLYNACLGISFT